MCGGNKKGGGSENELTKEVVNCNCLLVVSRNDAINRRLGERERGNC